MFLPGGVSLQRGSPSRGSSSCEQNDRQKTLPSLAVGDNQDVVLNGRDSLSVDKILCQNLHSIVNKVKETFMFLAGIEARSIIRSDEPFEPEILQKLVTAGKSSSGYSTMDIYSDIDSRVNNSLENTLIQMPF